MKIGFRLDANEKIATGHMMRCISIALKCRQEGIDCVFLLAQDINTDVLDSNEFKYIVMNGHWDDWNEDVSIVLEWIDKLKIKLLVVDSYQTTEFFLKQVNLAIPTIYIDDFCKTKYAVSGVINYVNNSNVDILENLYRKTKIKIISGTKYAPLRDEFSENIEVDIDHFQILLTTGGADPYHMTCRMVKYFLADKELQQYRLLIIIGKLNSDEEQIRELELGNDRIQVLKNVNNMAELMQKSYIAISAGGSTIFELCATKTPIVCFSFSDDQRIYTQELAKQGVLLYCGDARDQINIVGNISENVKKVIKDENVYKELQSNMSVITDGQGAARIAKELIKMIRTEVR